VGTIQLKGKFTSFSQVHLLHNTQQQKPETHKDNSIHNATSVLCAGKEVLSIDSAGKISLNPGASLDQLPPTGAQQFLFQVSVDLNI
jgi:hypothetical protein